MNNNKFKWWSIGFGTFFLLLLLVVYIFLPCPTNPQLNFFRVLLAIAAGAFAVTLSGTFAISNTLIKATSSVGVFALVYLVNPAGWNDSSNCETQHTKATIYLDDKTTQDIEVTIPAMSQRFFTDEFGNITLEYSGNNLEFPLKVNFKYKNVLDTTVTVTEKFKRKMEFKLSSKKSGSIGFTENSITYNLNGINVNLSMLNELPQDSYGEDTLRYHFLNKNDTIYIIPRSQLINSIKKEEVLKSVFGTDVILITRPTIDIKLTNNTSDAMVLNEMQLEVSKSHKVTEAVIIPTGINEIGFSNIGWGDALNLSINFNIVPFKNYKGWKRENYKWQYEIPQIKAFNHIPPDNITDATHISYNLATHVNLPPEAFEYGERVYFEPNLKKIYEELAGDYATGGIAYGTISYSEEDGTRKTQKFETFFEISAGYGSGLDVSYTYNTALKTSGNNYLVSVPISQGIKPKDFDRFTLKIAAQQSSNHTFRINILFEDKKIELPFIFKLKFFNTPLDFEVQEKIRA